MARGSPSLGERGAPSFPYRCRRRLLPGALPLSAGRWRGARGASCVTSARVSECGCLWQRRPLAASHDSPARGANVAPWPEPASSPPAQLPGWGQGRRLRSFPTPRFTYRRVLAPETWAMMGPHALQWPFQRRRARRLRRETGPALTSRTEPLQADADSKQLFLEASAGAPTAPGCKLFFQCSASKHMHAVVQGDRGAVVSVPLSPWSFQKGHERTWASSGRSWMIMSVVLGALPSRPCRGLGSPAII